MKKKSRLFALVGMLGLVALAGAEGATTSPPETFFCMCGCPDGTVVCVGSINGDCSVPCARAVQTLCPQDM